jgi:hypothetical protein
MMSVIPVVSLVLALAAPSTPPAIEPRASVRRIAELIEQRYYDPEAATRIAKSLTTDLEAGRFDALRDPRELAAVLTDRLRAEDAHFSVNWSPPPPPSDPSAEPAASAPKPPPIVDSGADARENFGFRRVEVLPGNVGVIEMTTFAHFEPEPLAGSAREVADAALAMVARAGALVIDLRDNRGGSPAMVGYLVGQFVPEDADVYNTFKSRGPDEYERPTVPITNRRLDTPLYVVTSGRTGSAAESFAYTLQAAGRATVVGAPTAGAANPGGNVELGGGLSIFISGGSPVNPITKKNWEGSGVIPDREVAVKDAQSVAYELALEAMLAKGLTGPAADEARWALEASRAGREAASVGDADRARFAGAYGTRVIKDEGGELIYVLDRRPPKRLIPLGGDLFTLEGAPYTRLEFERDAEGKATAMVVNQVFGSVSRFARTQ